MKNLILFDDDENWKGLLPLTYTRPISDLRVGILTIKDKWELTLNTSASFISQDHLEAKFPLQLTDDNVLVNSSYLPTKPLVLLIEDLKKNEAILNGDELVCARLDNYQFDKLIKENEIDEIEGYDISNQEEIIKKIARPHHIFENNGHQISDDFKLLTSDRQSQELHNTNTAFGDHPIFIEEGADIKCAILNSTDGPIYIGKNVTIMEGAIVRGPFALCDNAVVKMGAKIYKDTTIGPYSKVGGEISNVVFWGYSNKGHDGYLGNSVIGQWCNIGAGTESSNLKNNYDQVKVWSYMSERFERTGKTFHGLILGDHSKIGINCMLNTGTVIGVNCNIYGSGFPRNFIPSFSWGGHSGFITYDFEKSLKTAVRVMKRRNKELDDQDIDVLKYIYSTSSKFRTWE